MTLETEKFTDEQILSMKKHVYDQLPEVLVMIYEHLAKKEIPKLSRRQMIEKVLRTHPDYKEDIKKLEPKMIQKKRAMLLKKLS